MLCSFFEYLGVRVLGGIFNKIALEGFYNVEACRSAITSYFDQYRPACKAYGFVPVMPIETGNEEGASDKDADSHVVSAASLETFMSHVSVQDIISDVLGAQVYRISTHNTPRTHQISCASVLTSLLIMRCIMLCRVHHAVCGALCSVCGGQPEVEACIVARSSEAFEETDCRCH